MSVTILDIVSVVSACQVSPQQGVTLYLNHSLTHSLIMSKKFMSMNELKKKEEGEQQDQQEFYAGGNDNRTGGGSGLGE